MKEKIAILGTTPSRAEAPIADESWEIWTIGPGGKDMHRWNRLYETHTTWPEDFSGYLNDLSLVKPPQIVRSIVPMKVRMEHWAASHKKDAAWLADTIKGDWSANSVIDRDALFEKHRRMWFSTSICYAIVDAIYRDPAPKVIGCYGIDLESDEEHISQHMGCAHWLDLAKLSGIEVVWPKGCGLERDLNPYPDRYETHLANTYRKKIEMLGSIVPKIEEELEGVKMIAHRLEGAMFKMREAGQTAFPPDKFRIAEQEYQQAVQHLAVLNARLNHIKGEKSAVEYFQRMYVWGMLDPS